MPRNGTVLTITSSGGGSSVAKVAFPAIPANPGPPPVEAQDASEVLYIVDDQDADNVRAAFIADAKIDATGTPPSIGSVTVHR